MPQSFDGLAQVIEALGLRDPRIASAFRRIDRANFVPEELIAEAYADRPVPIPRGQTTSQPSLIAMMIDAAAPGPDDKVLEIGTGYGFQTALLAELARSVVSIDRWPELVGSAERNLARNGISNVSVHTGDGWKGYPLEAPYDAIVVSAAAESVPEALMEQLTDGGRLVIPVTSGGSDNVLLFVREGDKVVQRGLVSPARFVPLVRETE